MQLTPYPLDPLYGNLRIEEGDEPLVYDDANDTDIRAGYTVVGNPTVGIGHNLLVPMSDRVIQFILEDDVNTAFNTARSYSFFDNLNSARQMAFVDMVFNLGDRLRSFNTFLAYLRQGNYEAAANDLQNTAWYREVGARAERIAAIFRSGQWVYA